MSKLEDLDRLYKEVAEKKGTIDILFANAGVAETVETPAVTPEHSTGRSTQTLVACTSPSRRRFRYSMTELRSS